MPAKRARTAGMENCMLKFGFKVWLEFWVWACNGFCGDDDDERWVIDGVIEGGNIAIYIGKWTWITFRITSLDHWIPWFSDFLKVLSGAAKRRKLTAFLGEDLCGWRLMKLLHSFVAYFMTTTVDDVVKGLLRGIHWGCGLRGKEMSPRYITINSINEH